MIDVRLMLYKVMLFAALAVPGLMFGKFKKIDDNAIDAVTNILVYIAMPFLVLSKLYEVNPDELHIENMLCCLVLPIVLSLILWVTASVIFPKKENETKYLASRFCSVFSNCGFLGIPLANAVFQDEPIIVVYISLFNVSSTICLLTLGMYILSGKKADIGIKKVIFKPVTIAAVIGLVSVFSGLNTKFAVIGEYSSILAQLTTPLSMLVLGYELSKIRFRKIFITGSVYLVSFVKLVAAPAFTVAMLGVFGFRADSKFIISMFLASAVSTAASAPSLAKSRGVDSEFTAILTLGTTILSIITLPLLSALLEVILIY